MPIHTESPHKEFFKSIHKRSRGRKMMCQSVYFLDTRIWLWSKLSQQTTIKWVAVSAEEGLICLTKFKYTQEADKSDLALSRIENTIKSLEEKKLTLLNGQKQKISKLDSERQRAYFESAACTAVLTQVKKLDSELLQKSTEKEELEEQVANYDGYISRLDSRNIKVAYSTKAADTAYLGLLSKDIKETPVNKNEQILLKVRNVEAAFDMKQKTSRVVEKREIAMKKKMRQKTTEEMRADFVKNMLSTEKLDVANNYGVEVYDDDNTAIGSDDEETRVDNNTRRGGRVQVRSKERPGVVSRSEFDDPNDDPDDNPDDDHENDEI